MRELSLQRVCDGEQVHPVSNSLRKASECQFQQQASCDKPRRYKQRRKALNLTRLYWNRGSRAKALSS